MADYPKYFAKGDRVKTASNARQEVALKFDGYKQTDAPEGAAPASEVDRVDDTQAQLPLADAADEQPEAEEAPKSKGRSTRQSQ